MSEIVSKKQFLIATKDAKPIGKMGMANKLDIEMVGFFDEIAKAVLGGDDDIFVIQWAISKLDKETGDAVKERREAGN
jgi:transcription termination factor Rho